MSNLLKKARRIPQNFYMRALLQGGLKSGKTTLLGTYPGELLLLDVDGGAASLANLDHVSYLTVGKGKDIEDSEALIELLIELQTDETYQAVALDTITVYNANLLLEQAELRSDKKNADPNKQEIQDYQHVRNQILRTMNAFQALNKDVFIVGHTIDETDRAGEVRKKLNVTPKNLITEIPARLNQQFYLAVSETEEGLQRVLLMNNNPSFNVGCHVSGRDIPDQLVNPDLAKVIENLRG